MGEADGWLAAGRRGLFQLVLGWGLAVIAEENHLGIHGDKCNKGLIVLLDWGTRLMAPSHPGQRSRDRKGLQMLHVVKDLWSRFLGRPGALQTY